MQMTLSYKFITKLNGIPLINSLNFLYAQIIQQYRIKQILYKFYIRFVCFQKGEIFKKYQTFMTKSNISITDDILFFQIEFYQFYIEFNSIINIICFMNWNLQIQQEFPYQTSLYQVYPYYFSYNYPKFSQIQMMSPQPQIIRSNNLLNQEIDKVLEENQDKQKSKHQNRKVQIKKSFKQNRNEKKNIRNIIPNLTQKILNYISSQHSKKVIKLYFCSLTPDEIEEYYEFIHFQRSSLGNYIGNKDLKQIWYGKDEFNAKFFAISRFLSKKFLEDYCISSILLSKKMKPSLKKQHLRYRRKILKILNSSK